MPLYYNQLFSNITPFFQQPPCGGWGGGGDVQRESEDCMDNIMKTERPPKIHMGETGAWCVFVRRRARQNDVFEKINTIHYVRAGLLSNINAVEQV